MSGQLRQATKIMVIRHAEKPPTDPPPYGITLEGAREKDSLTARGWQRAGALASFFAPGNGAFQDPSLAKPQFLYSSKPVKHKGSRRPFETIMPLAEKLEIRINSDFLKFMLKDAFLREGVVLICWQREYIQEITDQILVNKAVEPPEWPEDRFDIVWVFDRNPSSAQYSFKQIPQSLLKGDLATLMK
jgi:broad specificity phosphatase PhoE